jgi:hypothetical protein
MPEPDPVTYAELVQLLTDLNYAPDRRQSAATYTYYQNPDRYLPIILQVRPADEPVRNTYLAMVEHILRENDAAAAREFERRFGGRWSRGLQPASAT